MLRTNFFRARGPMVRADPISAPRSTFVVAAPNRTGLSIFKIFHGIGVSAPRGGCRPVQFSCFRPESTPEDSPEPHSGALPGKCAHAGKVPKYQNFQSWGIPKEDSSSNYRRAVDREAFSKSRIRRLQAPAVPPLQHREHWVRETWEFVVFPDFADLGGGIRRENRRKIFPRKFHDGAC